MMDCNEYIEQISALVDNELSDEEEAAVLSHIGECPVCSSAYRTFCEIARCLPKMSVAPPDNLKDSIMQKISDEAKAARKPKLSFFRYAGFAAVFALVIFAAVNGSKVTNPGQTAEPEDSSYYEALSGSVPATAQVKVPEESGGEPRGSGNDSLPQSIYDMRYFSNYLETIPSEEYKNAADEYEGELYAILVLEGDVPAALQETDTLHENNREVYLEVSKDEIETLCKNSGDSLLIMNDASAKKGIVIIKKDED
jgi:hypothetical protein